MLEWKPVSSRLIKIRMREKHVNMTILQCYSSTNDKKDEIKDLFYEQLQVEVEITPRHDMLVFMSDLNSKVGSDNTRNERVMEKHGCGLMNEFGAKLLEFCNKNNLIVGGTLFPHWDIHKLKWYSPNNRNRNQIDHSLINGTWRRSLMDVKVKKIANVSSDYHLVVALIQLKLRSTQNKIYKPKRFDINKLQNSKKMLLLFKWKTDFKCCKMLKQTAMKLT